jgi:WD40 repeat protein
VVESVGVCIVCVPLVFVRSDIQSSRITFQQKQLSNSKASSKQQQSMSGRFVRASKFRHVHGVVAKKDKAYINVRTSFNGEGNYIAASAKYWSAAAVGGGGPVIVHAHANYGRWDHNAPKLNIHKAPVVDMAWSPFMDNLLATASEDCTIKISVIPEEGVAKVTEASASLEGHQKKLALVHFHPAANNILASSAFDNSVKVWDIERSTALFTIDEHPDLPQSFEWNENGSLIASTCKDKLVRVFDPRTTGAVMKATGLEGGKKSNVVWLDNHGKLIVVGFGKSNSRQYTLYDPKKLSEPLLAPVDIDAAASVIIPYYDPDTSMLYLAGKGDATVRYYEVVDEEPYVHFLSDFRDNESMKGACFLPKTSCDTKSCEIAICYRLMKEWVSPVSFQVPRKSDLFQTDIFPDTYAGVPSMSAEEWARGDNKAPAKKTMKPGEGTKSVAAKTEFKASASHSSASSASSSAQSAPAPAPQASGGKSAAELQRELDSAMQRIRDLEAQLAAQSQAPSS